ncbi:MAG: P-loop NTPase [Planctomycetes bacterium]|nr:P-loop NTPase [Planctomycetota bacterium]
MAKIISVHSFRGGTGKSNTTANLALMIATRGNKVGIVDTDIQSPGIHTLFGLTEDRITHALNDYLWDKCNIEDAAYDVTPPGASAVYPSLNGHGQVFLIPSSIKGGEIAKILREGYDVAKLNDGFHTLIEKLDLDYLFIDTHPGVNEETLLSIAISDMLVLIMRPDHQDYQGTAVTVDLARRLEVPKMMIIVNKVPPRSDKAALKRDTEKAYGVPVAATIALTEDMVQMASRDLFCLHHPNHELTRTLLDVAAMLAE